mmetsp:Transcript_14378/g.34411  ORF Transcript_14378/g.34411 Transcript_14378/m.34411 type:complete len:269 (-) Transcript_14378:40-846(-)
MGPTFIAKMTNATSQKRAAEQRARQVLLMCDQMDSCRRRLDVDASPGPIEFSPGAVLCSSESRTDNDGGGATTAAQRDQPSSLSSSRDAMTSLRTPTRANSDGSMSADDYRRALRTMQENAALKTERLQNEMASLQLELANATFQLEETKLALRNSERENEKMCSAMDYVVAGSEKTTMHVSEENAMMMKKMQVLRAERDALALENTMLKKGACSNIPSTSQHSTASLSSNDGGRTAGAGGTESKKNVGIEAVPKAKSLGFRASSLRK